MLRRLLLLVSIIHSCSGVEGAAHESLRRLTQVLGESTQLRGAYGGSFDNNIALADNVGSSGTFQTGFGAGYNQLFGGSGDIPSGGDLGQARLSDGSGATDLSNPLTRQQERAQQRQQSLTRGAGMQEQNANQQWSTQDGHLQNPDVYMGQDNAYLRQYQTSQGQQLVANAARQQQQMFRDGTAMNTRAARLANMAYRFRVATQGMAADRPIVTPEMAKELGVVVDDEEDVTADSSEGPSLPLRFRGVNISSPGALAAAVRKASIIGTGSNPQSQQQQQGNMRARSAGRTGPAQGYLDDYEFNLQPLRYETSGGSQADRDVRNLQLLKYIQDKGPFGDLILQGTPDAPDMISLVRKLNDQVRQAQGRRGQSSPVQDSGNSLSPEASQTLRQLLRVGYGEVSNTIPVDDGTSYRYASSSGSGDMSGSPQAGDPVGAPAGRGYGYGDYFEEDYTDEGSPTGIPDYMTTYRAGGSGDFGGATTSIGKNPAQGQFTGSGHGSNHNMNNFGSVGRPHGQGLSSGGGNRRNLTAGEIAPFCQPPILICADRDLISFLATEIDNVRFPDNVLEFNTLQFRRELVRDLLTDQNYSPWGGPTLNINNILSLNFRLRNTIAVLRGINGIGTNRLALNSFAWDASRPDRFLPETFSFNTLAMAVDNNFNKVKYVPTYIITGTGPGFPTTSIAFGPFTDFQVADFRS